MTPTKEQVEEARAWLAENWGIAPNPRDITDEGAERTVEMITILLAATDEPTDEELAREAAAYAPPNAACTSAMRRAYIAGARREGRK